MAVRVGVVGHVEWVDFIPVTEMPRRGTVTHAQGAFARAAGGGGVAAAVLADLGADVDFFLALGRDFYGRATEEQLQQRGVRSHVAWREPPTRRALTLLEDGGERTIVTLGDRLDPHGADALAWERLARADGVYVTAGDGAALARARDARVMTASPRARHALQQSDDPIDALVFSEHDGHERMWASRVEDRCRLMVATEGERGGRWWGEADGRWSAVTRPGPTRDTYGCGDAFAAAFTFALASGASIQEAADLGAQLGALYLTRRGAP